MTCLRSTVRVVLLSIVAVLLSGCATDTNLPVAPNVLRDGSGSTQLKALPPAQQTTDMQIMFVTDRAASPNGSRNSSLTKAVPS